MKLLAYIRSLVSTLFHRNHEESELDEELRSHIQRHADDLERSGLPRAEAERRANGSLQQMAAELDAPLLVVGNFQQQGDRIRITARIVNVRSGEALADAKAYVALLILTPLRIQGATGSPLRAIALAP